MLASATLERAKSTSQGTLLAKNIILVLKATKDKGGDLSSCAIQAVGGLCA